MHLALCSYLHENQMPPLEQKDLENPVKGFSFVSEILKVGRSIKENVNVLLKDPVWIRSW